MMLAPILPERSLTMLYAPRGIGKSWLGLSIGLAVASGCPLLRWKAHRKWNVLYIDGEMPLIALKERLATIVLGLGADVPNVGFRILAADNVEGGIGLSAEQGRQALEPFLMNTDLLILDNLSTLFSIRSESSSEAWSPIQEWLLGLRRQGLSVLFIHHSGTNGRQRGTSRREDVLDVVIGLRRPENYSPEDGARFQIHFEKLRVRVEGNGAVPFEAAVEPIKVDGREAVRWAARDLTNPVRENALPLFLEGLTVRQVAEALGISKSEGGRIRQRLVEDGLLEPVVVELPSSVAGVDADSGVTG